MLEAVKPGASEFDIYADVHDAIHRAGAIAHDPFLIMTWGADDVGWSEPPWTQSGGPPRIVEPGDLFMAEMFPTYGGMETQQQMSIAVAPVADEIRALGEVAEACYQAGIEAVRPGATFDQVVDAMLIPVAEADAWTLTPMIHSVSPLGWTGGMGFNRERMPNHLAVPHFKTPVQYQNVELVLTPGMSFAFEPNACRGQRRVNVGGSIVVAAHGAPDELNSLANRMQVVEA
jgi:Xaa-Pro aminopeptidase